MRAVAKFMGGLLLTIFFVTLMPTVCNVYITPWLIEQLGFLGLPDQVYSFLVSIMANLVIITFTLIAGGGGVLRKFGIIGVLGLIAAYWLLGDVTKAVVPIMSLIAVYLLLTPLRKRKKEKEKAKKDDGKAKKKGLFGRNGN